METRLNGNRKAHCTLLCNVHEKIHLINFANRCLNLKSLCCFISDLSTGSGETITGKQFFLKDFNFFKEEGLRSRFLIEPNLLKYIWKWGNIFFKFCSDVLNEVILNYKLLLCYS